ncbi:Meckelin_and transmembrane domain-containing protein [Hexamita inflata]|uniref:Meckelin_and transmembrane domain-containing protein n=2 Tax=Hexamita inflata TaxID=28002 RepID=A0ABP1KY78_9EUKA
MLGQLLILTLSILCTKPQQFNSITGGCTYACSTNMVYSTHFQQCVCDKNYIYDLKQQIVDSVQVYVLSCVPSTTAAVGQFNSVVAAPLSNPNSELECPQNTSLGYTSVLNTPICGIPMRMGYNKNTNEVVSNCLYTGGVINASLVFSTSFGKCYFPAISVSNGTLSTTDSELLWSSINLCMSYNNSQACRSAMNQCSRTKVNTSTQCNPVFSIKSENIPLVNISHIFPGNTTRTAYKQYNSSLADDKQPKYTNLMNIIYTVSDIKGNLLYKSLFFPQYFDLCSILQVGYDPILLQWQQNTNPQNRDRKIHHNNTYFNLEMLSRSGYDFIDVESVNYYPNMYGNNYKRSCRIGNENIKQQQTEYFITFYANTNETYNSGTNEVENQSFIIPVSIDGSEFHSMPIISVVNSQYIALNNITIDFGFYDDGTLRTPNITAQYGAGIGVSSSSPQIIRDITKLTFSSSKASKFGNVKDYFDFNMVVNYSYKTHAVSIRFIIIICVCLILNFIITGIPTAQRHAGFGKSVFSFQSSIGVILILLLSVYNGIIYGVVLDQCVLFIIIVSENVTYDITQDLSIANLVLLAHGIINLLRLFIQYFWIAEKLQKQYFIFDHGNQLLGHRKLFAIKQLKNLIQTEWSNFIVVIFTSLVTIFILSLQYTMSSSAQSQTTIQYFNNSNLTPLFCFIITGWYIFIGTVKSLIRLFNGNSFEKFGDMLSLLNCSFIGFDSNFSCHFIYGKSPFGDTDKDCQQLAQVMRNEAQGLYPRRGLQSGSSAQYFRIFFNEKQEDLGNLQKALVQVAEFEKNPSGQFGDALEGGDQYTNYRFNPRIQYVSATKADMCQQICQDSTRIISQLQQQPVFYGIKMNKYLDLCPNLPKQLSAVLIADPTESMGPRSLDTGSRPPGGFGGVPWYSNLFRYHSFLDIICIIGITCGIGNVGIGFCVGFILCYFGRLIEAFNMKKNIGKCMIAPDDIMI